MHPNQKKVADRINQERQRPGLNAAQRQRLDLIEQDLAADLARAGETLNTSGQS